MKIALLVLVVLASYLLGSWSGRNYAYRRIQSDVNILSELYEDAVVQLRKCR